ncbi:hypothetical protein [uncultured Tateyamaria sp.]|uniref:hypothetical protein n=1 Tax=uncultured Tateyamaria sp. TaxID=455651 RepID=UPI0026187FDB|nr:hypothetical protein [uncultured Tateyamaria sp.]
MSLITCNKLVELLLASITNVMGNDGALASFQFRRPGASPSEAIMATEIYYHHFELNLASLFLRSNGPNYLHALSLDEISSLLKRFLSENFWYIRRAAYDFQNVEPYSQWITDAEKLTLALVMMQSNIFQPQDDLVLFPLVPVSVEGRVKTSKFFFSNPRARDAFDVGQKFADRLDPTTFPPSKGFTGKKNSPGAWLGIYSPNHQHALKLRSSILGAMALSILPQYRYTFSMRKVFGGTFTIKHDSVSYNFDKRHTPPCAYEVQIEETDQGWVDLVSEMLVSNEKSASRGLKALEYFFRAWPQRPEERFPIHCMALDALFGHVSNATGSVIDGVLSVTGETVDSKRLREILQLRAAVIHGGAPDVYDSSKYPKYYRKYGADPISDLESVLSLSIKELVFKGQIPRKSDPNAKIIEQAKSRGLIPPRIPDHSILRGYYEAKSEEVKFDQ